VLALVLVQQQLELEQRLEVERFEQLELERLRELALVDCPLELSFAIRESFVAASRGSSATLLRKVEGVSGELEPTRKRSSECRSER
jgi:hypothetical protein